MSIKGLKRPVELVLASSSPRRREIVKLLGFPCICVVASDDEEEARMRYRGPIENIGLWLAKHKASVALKLPEAKDRLIITADTTVILEHEDLGKPRDAEHAFQLLQALRGRWHHVITGVVVSTQIEGKVIMHSTSCITPVLMRNYSDAEIDAYIASGDPFDKAGAYGVQNPAFQPTERIDGCYFNVVGLPICTLIELLGEFEVYPSRRRLNEKAGCPWSEECRL